MSEQTSGLGAGCSGGRLEGKGAQSFLIVVVLVFQTRTHQTPLLCFLVIFTWIPSPEKLVWLPLQPQRGLATDLRLLSR